MALLDEFYENLVSKATGLKTGLLQSLNRPTDDLSVLSNSTNIQMPINNVIGNQVSPVSQPYKPSSNINESYVSGQKKAIESLYGKEGIDNAYKKEIEKKQKSIKDLEDQENVLLQDPESKTLLPNLEERISSKQKELKDFLSAEGKKEFYTKKKKEFGEEQKRLGYETSTTKEKENVLGISNKQAFKIFGLTISDIQKNWAKNGGFEGLMASPTFQIGLGIIQTSMLGKQLGTDIQDIILKSGAVSSAYKDKIKSRTKQLAPINMDQRREVETELRNYGLEPPDVVDKLKAMFKGDKVKAEARYNEALALIYEETEKVAESKTLPGQSRRRKSSDYREAVDNLVKSGKISVTEAGFIFPGTVKTTSPGIKGKASGGPVAADKSYIVGEKGPELFVPELDGNIINNDDLKVVNMLLESNPQLKGISRARAVKILKARFPDYF